MLSSLCSSSSAGKDRRMLRTEGARNNGTEEKSVAMMARLQIGTNLFVCGVEIDGLH